MQTSPTLYKIRPCNAAKDAAEHTITVETTSGTDVNHPHLLFCGGFHSSMRGNKAQFLAELCQAHGWSYTRFDYRGHGESEADAEHCTLTHWLDDTLAVIDNLPRITVLIGSSMGAWLAVHALLQRPEKIRSLLTIAAAADFPQTLLWQALSDAQQQALENGECITHPTPYEETDWRIRKGLFDSGKELALLDHEKALDIRVPIRMLHGTADKDVPWTHSQRLLDRFSLSADANLTLIQGADHRLSDPKQLELLQEQLERLVEAL